MDYNKLYILTNRITDVGKNEKEKNEQNARCAEGN